MKFMMNEALTIGTRDGAHHRNGKEANEENFFLFGLTAEQMAGSRGWYSPQWHYDNEPETHAALDLTFSNYFSRYEPGIFGPIRDTLLNRGGLLYALGRLKSYLETQGQGRRALNGSGWLGRQSYINVACSGRFSSDRTISEYAAEVWHAKSCPVGYEAEIHRKWTGLSENTN